MKNLKIYFLLSLILLLMANSCDKMMEKRFSIKIVNETNKAIQVTVGCSKYNMKSFPDTTLPNTKPYLVNVKANDYNFLDHSFKWEDVISELPSDTLSIYIFATDTINYYEWSQIKEHYMVLNRYDLSSTDLKNMNWTVNYSR